jgi:hypothetical protein
VCDATVPVTAEVVYFKKDGPLDEDTTEEEYEQQGLYLVGGNHTKAALMMALEICPDNEDWQYMPCHVDWAESPDDPDAARYLQSQTDLLNKRKVNKLISYREYEQKMHNEGKVAEDKHGKIVDLPGMKSDWSTRFGLSLPTIGQIWQTAKMRGDLREAYEDVREGRVADSRSFKKPTSSTSFRNIGPVRSYVLLSYLNKVKQRTWSLSKFDTECQNYKIELTIRKAVLAMSMENTWRDCKVKWPTLCQGSWIALWVPAFRKFVKQTKRLTAAEKKKLGLYPPEFVRDVEDKMSGQTKV